MRVRHPGDSTAHGEARRAVRTALKGRNGYILVLDTRGVNVWCAAGKGTFGTEELVSRLESEGLERIVRHRTLIAPQLGATGVSAHRVKQRSGFRVIYGPVRAADLPSFLDSHPSTPESELPEAASRSPGRGPERASPEERG